MVSACPHEAELRALEHVRADRSDGVIVATGRHSARVRALEMLDRLARDGSPVVILLDRSPVPTIPAIRVDVEHGAYLAISHLVQLGHRRIAHVALHGGEPLEGEQTSQGDRYRGYRIAG